jgi:hypothetical protein
MASPPLGYYTVSLHGRYYQPANLGRLFSGGNQAPVPTALPAGLTESYTGGLVLYNPVGSGVNVALLLAEYALVVAQTNAASIGLAVGQSATAPTGTLTAIAPVPGVVGSSATPEALLYSSAAITLPVVPTLVRNLGVCDTGALTTGPSGAAGLSDLGGSIILPPGGFACFVSTAAGTASSFLGAFTWEEITQGSL